MQHKEDSLAGWRDTPLVSFVVPCYNYGQSLADCLRSIFGQEGGYDFEVIVVNDGSTDNTQQILHTFADPRLRVSIHLVNRGHVTTINAGVVAKYTHRHQTCELACCFD